MFDEPGRKWAASWVSYTQHPEGDLGTFWFKREFELAFVPKEFEVFVSADQRYRLYVNGVPMGEGPQRSDLRHWMYESFDIAPWLVSGKNKIEALVWNYGRYAPMAQHTYRLGFLLDGPGVSTPQGWEVAQDAGRSFEMLHSEVGPFYIDIGPGETITSTPHQDLEWKSPNVIGPALARGEFNGDSAWWLVPRSLPQMQRQEFVGRVSVVDVVSGAREPLESRSVKLTPDVSVHLDFGELLTAYPRFRALGKANVTVTYGEAPFDQNGSKGNRSDFRGKKLQGYQDKFIFDSDNLDTPVSAAPTWWRTWRYLRLQTDRPVSLFVDADETGYPMQIESRFVGDDPWIERIWDVSVRTLRRCAGETFFDCPYYEQLQYVGDTRIQALAHCYLGRDRRLVQNAVRQFIWSQETDGTIASRHPSRVRQVIPGFGWFFCCMLRDQMLLDDSLTPEHCRRLAHELRPVVERSDNLAHWPFLDWVPGWGAGIPPGDYGHSAFVALRALASHALACLEKSVANAPVSADMAPLWDLHARRIADGKERESDHFHALARVLELESGQTLTKWPRLDSPDKATLYFQYYRHLAMQPADYLAELGAWKRAIEAGLTTFPETEDPCRSDCHAWSAHPIIGFFRFIAGIESTAPGWKRARIAPRPGSLRHFEATLAHPLGNLIVNFTNDKLSVDSPVDFDLEWMGKASSLPAGRHSF